MRIKYRLYEKATGQLVHRLAGLHSEFISNFSTIKRLLTALTKKDRANTIKDWQYHCDEVF